MLLWASKFATAKIEDRLTPLGVTFILLSMVPYFFFLIPKLLHKCQVTKISLKQAFNNLTQFLTHQQFHLRVTVEVYVVNQSSVKLKSERQVDAFEQSRRKCSIFSTIPRLQCAHRNKTIHLKTILLKLRETRAGK